MSTKSLYVGNLPYSATSDDLERLFQPYGPVENARVVANRGFGFIDVPDEKVDEAVSATNGREYQGRTLTVNEARPRAERAGERGGAGRGGYGGGGRGGGGRPGGGRRGW